MERICQVLETILGEKDKVCACCELSVGKCTWCTRAIGYHRCQRLVAAHSLSLCDIRAYAWKRHSLYDAEGFDIQVCVLQMLGRSAPKQEIADMLDNLYENNYLKLDKYSYWMRFLSEQSNTFIDKGSVTTKPNHTPILQSSAAPWRLQDRKTLLANLARLEDKMQNVWDSRDGVYKKWNEFTPPRSIPAQYKAFQQLKYRFQDPTQFIAVALVAPAGFGKSELLSAWLHFLEERGVCWEPLGITGIAAAQLSGRTVHNFALLRADGSTSILTSDIARQHLRHVQGLLIDEAFMAEDELLSSLFEVLQEVPLLESLRRVDEPYGFLLTGHRDLIICGDPRQLTPASGRMPFWGTTTFANLFEIFRLDLDRRHEKDVHMQSIKEKFAWGGVQDLPTDSDANPWPVDADVFDLVADGYIRGWGLNGHTVDLDVGTALFPRRADVKRWNDSCVEQIEREFGTECEALDVHGYDPRNGNIVEAADKTSAGGIQTPQILKLRTCPKHRQRLMLLSNLDISSRWANATRVRTLAVNSWSHCVQKLERMENGKHSAKQLTLSDRVAYPDFNVRVVRDEESTLAKTVRYNALDCTSVPVQTDKSSQSYQEWRQVQATLSYALTIHKCQGLTMPVTYPALVNVFGFGMAYTIATRTPYAWNMLFIGVPPQDVLSKILHKGPDQLCLIERKKKELLFLLSNENALRNELHRRVQAGEFDLQTIGEELIRRNVELSDETDNEMMQQLAFDDLLSKLRIWLADWAERLDVEEGLRVMVKVSEGFKLRNGNVHIYENRGEFPKLARVLQGDAKDRQRIKYYKQIATDWMLNPTVDVLANCRLDRPTLPTRDYSKQKKSCEDFGSLLGYANDGYCVPRECFPAPPQDFEW